MKPKHSGQFDHNAVQFSYVQNHDKKKQLQEQERKLKEEFAREVKTKLAKKSKNALVEVPAYLTQDELLDHFRERKEAQGKLHRERQD